MNADNQPSEDARRAFMSTCAFCNKPLDGEVGAMISLRDIKGQPGYAFAHGECVVSRLHPAMRETLEQLS
jgi:hypothetical protein